MPQSTAEYRAVYAIEAMVSPFVNKKMYDVLLAMQAMHGVSLSHSLAAAVYAGKHEQAQWFLDRGVMPNTRVLRLAIAKSKQMTARILPYVQKFAPEHADVAASTGQTELLERIIDSGVYPSAFAYRLISKYSSDDSGPEIDLLLRKGEPWRVGTQALLDLMPRLTGQQIFAAISAAPSRFNREKLLARALRCGSDAVVQEIAHYGFGTKVTARVALRAVGEKLTLLRSASKHDAVRRLALLHFETHSAPLNPKVLCRLLSGVVRTYIATFWGDETERASQKKDFMDAIERVLSLGDPDQRVETLKLYEVQFLIDRVESPEAKHAVTNQNAWPMAYTAFTRFRGEFEAYLQEEASKAEVVDAYDLDPSFGGP